MYANHILLGFLWILYCAVHSILAAPTLKNFLKKSNEIFFRYYRLAYSIFAFITLALLLYFQYSFRSYILLRGSLIKYLAFIILVLPGLVIMIISIIKYFKLLSGVRSLYQPQPSMHLKLDGIHKYVRHPLYLGTLLFIWGLFFLFPLLNNLIAVVIINLYVLIGVPLEEKKLLKEFGNEYAEYKKQVPRLLPKVIK